MTARKRWCLRYNVAGFGSCQVKARPTACKEPLLMVLTRRSLLGLVLLMLAACQQQVQPTPKPIPNELTAIALTPTATPTIVPTATLTALPSTPTIPPTDG